MYLPEFFVHNREKGGPEEIEEKSKGTEPPIGSDDALVWKPLEVANDGRQGSIPLTSYPTNFDGGH